MTALETLRKYFAIDGAVLLTRRCDTRLANQPRLRTIYGKGGVSSLLLQLASFLYPADFTFVHAVIRLCLQTFYRGVVFDRLLGRECQQVTAHAAALKAAGASALFFGGVHLCMHLLREGPRLPWYDKRRVVDGVARGNFLTFFFYFTYEKNPSAGILVLSSNAWRRCPHEAQKDLHDTLMSTWAYRFYPTLRIDASWSTPIKPCSPSVWRS